MVALIAIFSAGAFLAVLVLAAVAIPAWQAARITQVQCLYDRYKIGIEVLTREHMQQGPSNDEWLASAVQPHSPPTGDTPYASPRRS
jgi:hypothetical protein